MEAGKHRLQKTRWRTYCAFAHGEAAGSACFITAPTPRDHSYRSRKRRGSGHQLKFSRAAAWSQDALFKQESKSPK
jgi:hypothetical protein